MTERPNAEKLAELRTYLAEGTVLGPMAARWALADLFAKIDEQSLGNARLRGELASLRGQLDVARAQVRREVASNNRLVGERGQARAFAAAWRQAANGWRSAGLSLERMVGQAEQRAQAAEAREGALREALTRLLDATDAIDRISNAAEYATTMDGYTAAREHGRAALSSHAAEGPAGQGAGEDDPEPDWKALALSVIEAGIGLQNNVMHHCDSMATIEQADCACGLRAKMQLILSAYRELDRYDQWAIAPTGKAMTPVAAEAGPGAVLVRAVGLDDQGARGRADDA